MKLTIFICLLLAGLNGNALAATKDSNKIAIQKCEMKYKTDVIKKNACIAKINKMQKMSASKVAKNNTLDPAMLIKQCEKKYKKDSKKKNACIAKVKKDKISKQQASKLSNQQKQMKSTKAMANGKTSLTQMKTASGKTLKAININTATAQEIASSLPGVGAAKAQAIVDYRQQYGEFKSASDLADVKGLGKKSVAKMEAYLKY